MSSPNRELITHDTPGTDRPSPTSKHCYHRDTRAAVSAIAILRLGEENHERGDRAESEGDGKLDSGHFSLLTSCVEPLFAVIIERTKVHVNRFFKQMYAL